MGLQTFMEFFQEHYQMKRLWLILFVISCTTAPKVNYEGEVNEKGEYQGQGTVTYTNGEKYSDIKEGLV